MAAATAATVGNGRGRVPGRMLGFTLIELMIVVAIVAVLAALAISGYGFAMKKSRRSTAQACLQTDAQFMERFYASNLRYDQNLASVAVALPACTTDVSAFYSITMPTVTQTHYLIQAATVSTSPQANDVCGTMTVNQLGVKTAASTTGCW
jgi:type IV pilus assembly protein PilE